MRPSFLIQIVILLVVLLIILLTLDSSFYATCIIYGLFAYIIGKEVLDEIKHYPPEVVAAKERTWTPPLMLTLVIIILVVWLTLPTEYVGHVAILALVLNIVFSSFIYNQTVTIMAKQTELAAELRGVTAQIAKIGTESTKTLEKVAALEELLANEDNVSPELQTAFDELKAQVTLVDDLIPDTSSVEDGAGGDTTV